MKNFILIVLLFLTRAAFSQDLVVPQNYKFKTKEDFLRYQPDVIKCINWLAETPRNQKQQKRKEAEDFSVSWIYKCPYVSVFLEQYVMKISAKNPDLVLSFLFGFTKYTLEHPEEKSLLTLNMAGLTNLLNDYEINKSTLTQDDDLDTLIYIRDSQKLSDWLKPQLTRTKN
ncbi:hypothetical protein GS399_16210 [Pedobacter sp. HMF7647]|uniref:Uncharacterized protein n=1 Tax=Hufsiella arboris TaxID=2695275 RepID=A0A7K1YDQ1_9SPHI|nr:hypothetical protein [Hufsiella arboris]MXV52520.1 hypothetical protein [Hufsiella arboris]